MAGHDDLEAAPIWVTGAGGFIGRHMSRMLAEGGHVIVGLGNTFAPDFAGPGHGAFFAGGLTRESLSAALEAHGTPAAVFHLAGGATVGQSIADPLRDFTSTVASSAVLLDFLRRNAPSSPVVISSSAAVYGADHDGPIATNAALRPFSPYGHHKRMVEQLAESFASTYGQPIAVVRLFSVYGEGLRKQLLYDLCCRLARGERHLVLGGTGQETRDWRHVSDVVDLLRRLLPARGEAGLTYHNGGGGAEATVREVAQRLLDAWGVDATLAFSGECRPGDPFRLIADGAGLPAGFRWRVSPAEGIPAYVRWFRDEQGAAS